MADDALVIVGGGLAAARLVAEYRAGGGEALVTVLSADDALPYNRPPLSKGYLRGELEEADVLVQPPSFYDEQVVDVRLGTRVAGVDAEKRVVRLEDGGEVAYGTLVLATGSTPRALDVPGADLVGVHAYRTLADARAVRAAAEESPKALVVGGSFIGTEVAASLRRRGLDVTLVEAGPRLTPAFASADLSDQVADLFRAQGVDVRVGDQLRAFRGNGRLLTGADLASGDVEAFLAVVGVGVRPSLDYLQGSGIEVDDGVVVDERFRTSMEGVYAIGDAARFPDPVFGRSRRIEHWTSANAQGGALGRMLAGSRERYDELSVFFTELFGHKLQLLGDLDGGVDEVVLRGRLAETPVLGYYLRDDRLVGAVVSGHAADVVRELEELVRAMPAAPDRERLADESLRPAAAFA